MLRQALTDANSHIAKIEREREDALEADFGFRKTAYTHITGLERELREARSLGLKRAAQAGRYRAAVDVLKNRIAELEANFATADDGWRKAADAADRYREALERAG